MPANQGDMPLLRSLVVSFHRSINMSRRWRCGLGFVLWEFFKSFLTLSSVVESTRPLSRRPDPHESNTLFHLRMQALMDGTRQRRTFEGFALRMIGREWDADFGD